MSSSPGNQTQLDSLKEMTKVVADTGDFSSMREFEPQDATTNPTLIYSAIQMDEYAPLLDEAIGHAADGTVHGEALVHRVVDHLLVNFGRKILDIVPGRVSTEVDARLSFDAEGTVEKAHEIIRIYEASGVPRERILIKVASTWEGIRAAEQLEEEGIHCNMTLLFSMPQAIACAEAGVTLISPFVGRILDWYRANEPDQDYSGANDPGVQSVVSIYNYYKKFEHATEVMGASFRNAEQIRQLAGCDLLTISPKLLGELAAEPGPLERRLDPESAREDPIQQVFLSEKTFRWRLNQDPMATEKLAEGIRRFAADIEKLEELIEREMLDE